MEKTALDDGEPPMFEDHEEFKEGAEDLPGHFGFYKRVSQDRFRTDWRADRADSSFSIWAGSSQNQIRPVPIHRPQWLGQETHRHRVINAARHEWHTTGVLIMDILKSMHSFLFPSSFNMVLFFNQAVTQVNRNWETFVAEGDWATLCYVLVTYILSSALRPFSSWLSDVTVLSWECNNSFQEPAAADKTHILWIPFVFYSVNILNT